MRGCVRVCVRVCVAGEVVVEVDPSLFKDLADLDLGDDEAEDDRSFLYADDD